MVTPSMGTEGFGTEGLAPRSIGTAGDSRHLPHDLPRPWWPAVRNGLRCRCPACGEGRLFSGFLKVVPVCAHCGEDLTAQRSDDLPPYIVITIVGHIVGTGILATESISELPLWMHALVWPLVTIVLCFMLMQPIKGAVVAHQWALRMQGFGTPEQTPPIDGSRSIRDTI